MEQHNGTTVFKRVSQVIWTALSIDCIGFTLLCSEARKLAPPSQPIRCKSNSKLNLVARVFPPLLVLVLLGSSGYFPLSLLAIVNTSTLDNFGVVLQRSIEKRSNEVYFPLIRSLKLISTNDS